MWANFSYLALPRNSFSSFLQMDIFYDYYLCIVFSPSSLKKEMFNVSSLTLLDYFPARAITVQPFGNGDKHKLKHRSRVRNESSRQFVLSLSLSSLSRTNSLSLSHHIAGRFLQEGPIIIVIIIITFFCVMYSRMW